MSETLQKIRSFLQKSYDEAARDLKLHDEIRRLLAEKFIGKQITKRTLTYIQKNHPSWVVTYYGVANSVYIRVWGGDSGFRDANDYGRVFIGYSHEHHDGFSIEAFDRGNMHIPNTRKEQEARFKLLMNQDMLFTIAGAIDEFNARKAVMLDMVGSLPDHYDFEKLFIDKK